MCHMPSMHSCLEIRSLWPGLGGIAPPAGFAVEERPPPAPAPAVPAGSAAPAPPEQLQDMISLKDFLILILILEEEQ